MTEKLKNLYAELGKDLFEHACECFAECEPGEHEDAIMQRALDIGLAKCVPFSSKKYPVHSGMIEEGDDYYIWGKALERYKK